METKPKNRAWVKDAAIVFLVVLLLLTFFSNTIMNHSLPEVATQMVTDGTITAKVRGTGTVAANGSHKVKAKVNETIGRVMVKAGQEVSAGDVLFVLGPGDSDQLEEAKAALDDLQTQYAQAALSVPIASALVNERNAVEQSKRAMEKAYKAWQDAKSENIKPGDSETVKKLLTEKQTIEENINIAGQKLEAEQLVLTLINGKVAQAEAKYNKLYAEWQSGVIATPSPSPTEAPPTTSPDPSTPGGEDNTNTGNNGGAAETTGTGEAGKEAGTAAAEAAANVLFRPFAKVGTQSGSGTLPTEADVNAAYEEWQALVAEENRLKTAEVAALMGVDGTVLQIAAGRLTYITGLQYTINTLQLKLNAISAQLKTYGVDTEGVNTLYEAYLQAQEDYNSKMDALNNAAITNERSIASASAGLGSISNKIKRQQEKIKQLTGEGDDNTVTANVSGTVTEVNCTAGDAVLKDDILCAIEVPDMGYTVSFSVTNDQAKRLHVGDTATISNYYWGNQIVATLSTIQTDKKNPMSNKLLTFDLDGDVTSGSEITVSVGQKSARYDLIIPNSAIRTDSNGSFVLAVMAKSSPLGNRYVAKRVAIEVLAADDTNSAVTADLSNGDYVITTSSAPIANGDMVRMADAQS